MTLRAIVTGSLSKVPVEKTSSRGNAYLIASVREGSGDATRYVSAFIFAEDEIETVRSLQVGEPISVAGELTVELSEWNGESRLNWKITADAVLSARAKPKQAKLQDGKPASHLPPSSNDSRQPFDTKRWEGGPAHQIADDITFMWEGR
jgi:hypothetical protein